MPFKEDDPAIDVIDGEDANTRATSFQPGEKWWRLNMDQIFAMVEAFMNLRTIVRPTRLEQELIKFGPQKSQKLSKIKCRGLFWQNRVKQRVFWIIAEDPAKQNPEAGHSWALYKWAKAHTHEVSIPTSSSTSVENHGGVMGSISTNVHIVLIVSRHSSFYILNFFFFLDYS